MNNLEDGRNKIWKKGREERINSRYKTRARGTYNQRWINYRTEKVRDS